MKLHVRSQCQRPVQCNNESKLQTTADISKQEKQC